ncbi:MAG: hypothetical protein WCO51_12590, partial [bacterium]
PHIEWRTGNGEIEVTEGFFSKAEVIDGKLTLSGQAGPHLITLQISISDGDRVHIKVSDSVAGTDVQLGQLMSQFYFTPGGKAFGYTMPLDFAWLPNLHDDVKHVCGDHFFRSPAAIVVSEGVYAALIPDLDALAKQRIVPHALDLRVDGTPAEAPRLSYGLCTWHADGHVFNKHEAEETAPVSEGELAYEFDLFFGPTEGMEGIVQRVTTYLWERYGRRFMADIRPQIMPFEEYGRRYAYPNELKKTVAMTTINGKQCAGINNPRRRGSNFHAWENDLHVGFGIRHYGEKWGSEELRQIGDGILQLSLAAPSNKGAFACVYNWETGKYEGSFFETARSIDPMDGYDSAAMSVSAWWRLYWYEHYGQDPEILSSVVEYSRFLTDVQLPSGAIPTYFFSDLKPARQLLESATTAISGATLAKTAAFTGDPKFVKAALKAGEYLLKEILPKTLFQDFEAFYSCSPKPLHWIDRWTGIPPVNNLAIQWAADHFLSLYQLTNESHWLEKGEYTLGLLSLFQQVWTPPHFEAYLFGGFGVMNTDSEWNDGRQARFVSTYADYYRATGKLEYLERSIASCRAAFALMDIEENHRNNINQIVMAKGPGEGYALENVGHAGEGSIRGGGWSGYNWSAGGALAAGAYLERYFGNVWVDTETKTVVPIDGVRAELIAWEQNQVKLIVKSALDTLPCPYTEQRNILIKFGNMPTGHFDINVNGEAIANLSSEQLRGGITICI